MQASNAVSTIFRCMSCSYGTRCQNSYADHIKHCNKESENEKCDAKEEIENLSQKVKRRYRLLRSYACKECSVPTGSSKALLLHMRDVHGDNSQIFSCRFCSRYASYSTHKTDRHAKGQHAEEMSKGGKSYEIVQTKLVIKQDLANDAASIDKHCTPDDVSQRSTHHAAPVKSSRSLGLQFLGKQFPDFGRDGFVCQLCSFSHVFSHLVVKHIWEEHRDKLNELATEVESLPAGDEANASNTLYKCDDCPFTTHYKRLFYNHCSHHRFNGPSKCLHCSYSALSDTAVSNHTKKYHDIHQISNTKTTPSSSQPQNARVGASGLGRNAKKRGNRRYQKVYGRLTKRNLYTCPYCHFRTYWCSSMYRHKVNVHAQLINADRARSSAGSSTPDHKLQQKDAVVAAASKSNLCEKPKPVSRSLLLAAASTPVKHSEFQYTCNVCSRKYKSMRLLSRHKEAHLNLKRYQCSLCGLRSNYTWSVKKHLEAIHKLEKGYVIRLSAVDAEKTVKAYTKRSAKLPNSPEKRKLSSEAVADDGSLCRNVESGKCKTKKHFGGQKEGHMNFRRFQCSLCGLRSNYSANMYKHAACMHKPEKARVIRLSIADAKETIRAYEMRLVKLSHSPEKRRLSSETDNRLTGVDSSSKAVHNSTSTPTERMQTNSSQQASLKSSGLTTNAACVGSKKYYMCSVCKKRSNYKRSIYQHCQKVHFGKAKVLIKSEVKALHTVNKKRNLNVDSDNFGNSNEKKCRRNSDNAEHSYASIVEFGRHCVTGNDDILLSTPVVSAQGDMAVQSLELPKKRFVCDTCPYSTDKPDALAAHCRLHVKRAGYTFACSYCPYYACQKAHLHRHLRLHNPQLSIDSMQSVSVKKCKKARVKARVYACELCPFKTAKQAVAVYHRQLHRPRSSAPYKCKHCNFWVSCPNYLFTHTRLHNSEAKSLRTQSETSNSFANDVEMASQKHKITTSYSSSDVNEVNVPLAKYSENTACGKANEVIPSKSLIDSNKDTVKLSGASLSTEENASVPVSSTSVSRHLPSWFCDRCPYSASTLPCFKRHEWLHGKHYQYECCYCDYSVQSYWQLVSHVLWHFEPNRHLLYAQSVSNLDSVPSQLPSYDSILDSMASVDRYIPSFENSDVFLLSDESNFQCHCCPYAVERRSEFFSHMICHCVRIGYGCPYCSFHADVSEKLTAHVYLHFNLPGCRQSSVPPNVCHSLAWKQLDSAVEATAEKLTRRTLDEQEDSLKHSDMAETSAESEPLKADAAVSDVSQTGPAEHDDELSANRPISAVRMVHSITEHAYALPQPAGIDVVSGVPSASVDDKLTCAAELPVSDLTSVLSAKFCQYCDKIIADPDVLSKHESSHLIGFSQP